MLPQMLLTVTLEEFTTTMLLELQLTQQLTNSHQKLQLYMDMKRRLHISDHFEVTALEITSSVLLLVLV